ncbi:MAG: adenylate/guanylate cyclase domain-containing protein [Candidatus Limnocylindria bacterium]
MASRADASPPSGTGTFVFTDIEGSTNLVASLGTERYGEVLEAQRRILRSAIAAHDGYEVRTEGDAFFVVFRRPSDAVAAAADAQLAIAREVFPHDVVVRVRIGMHTGEATLSRAEVESDYVGLDVHRAARIAAAGHGAQILLSETTRSLVQDNLPPNTNLRDLGDHRLKDLTRSEHIFQLDLDARPMEFPPLRTLDVPTNLPTQLTSFVGRDREIAEASRLLSGTRLLTLTGPGGTGKTRLSLQVAAESAASFSDGAFFVPLAPVFDPELVASTIAQVLHVPVAGANSPLRQLLELLERKRMLLVLDNFEQVVSAAPQVADLLRGVPGLKIIVTTRAKLHVSGEQEYPVPPLALPDPRALPGVDALSQYEAVRLFIERAVAAKPDFRVSNENAPAVAGICARLDGLPLAIELAAARIKVLPPAAMLARLEKGMGLLGGTARDLPERQRTLRGAIAWSHDLLGLAEKRVFERFGVFVGGGALEQMEPVCGPNAELGVDILDAAVALVDQSLIRQVEADGEPRFLMLETIREFAVERLESSGDAAATRDRHADAYAELAEAASPHAMGSDERRWLDHLEREHANLRAALDWSVSSGRTKRAMRLVYALWRFWQRRGHLAEASERAAVVLALPHSHDHPLDRARALEAAGGIAYWRGDMAAAEALYRESTDIMREHGTNAELANALYNLAFPSLMSREKRSEIGVPLLQQAQALWREIGDRAGLARALWALGTNLQQIGDYEGARPYADETVSLMREVGKPFDLGWALHLQGSVAAGTGRLAEAGAAYEDAMCIFRDAADVTGVLLVLSDFSELARAEGDRARAVTLVGAVSALRHSSGAGLQDIVDVVEGRMVAGELAADDQPLLAAGRAMSLEEAVRFALRPRAPAPEPAGGRALLQ